MKKILIGLVVILVLIVGALFVVPPIIGNSVVKSRIIEAVKEATGRDLQIADVSLAVLPSVSVSITGLRLANAEGASVPDMVSVRRVDLDLQLFPLIGKEVIVDRLVISDLAASLEVNEAGVPNWAFGGAADDDESEAVETGEGEGALLADLRLGDVRLENARLSYRDMTSGQTIEASEVNLAAALPNIAGKLSLTGGLTLNRKTVHIDLGVESPQALMTGQPVKLTAAIRSELIELQSDLGLAQRPQLAVDGNATITIGSVGALLAWLEQPLPADQPDPGPVKLAATFKTEGAKVILEEAIVEGEALDLKAHGSFVSEGGVNKVALVLESDVLDIDRYLPPPAPGTAAPEAEKEQAEMGGARREHPLKAIPDEPIDLTLLKQTEADITIAIAGIKAAGYEVGKLAFTAQLAGGKLQADLSELALYGGGVTGTLSLDGSGDALGVEADFKLDKVDLGALTAVAADGEAPVAGVASGSLTASARGVSPRALVQDLKGDLVFKLGEVDVKNATAGAISGVDLAIDLPGLAQSPSVKGQVVYNKRKVALDVGLDPLDKVLAGETFALTATLDSKLLKLSYDGLVHQQPLPGLDGRFNLASPSVGKLAAWLGHPLDPKQPDPGPLKIDAVLKVEAETAVLEQAVIEGEALKAEASGSVDISGEVKKITLDVKAGMLDIDRYLPPPQPVQESEAGQAPAPDGGQAPANPLAAIPDEPIDLAALQGTEADVSIALDGLRAAGFELGQTQIGLKLAGGKLALEIGQLALYGGDVQGRVDVDGSGEALGFAVDLSVANLAVGDLARAAGVEPAPLEGVMTASLKARSQGKSPRALVAALSADLGLQMSDTSLAAVPDMAIGTLDVTLAVPALDQVTNGTVALTLNGKPLEASFAVDSPQKAMQGEAFGLQVAVTSDLLKASIEGLVQQQPLPGLDGVLSLEVASVGKLAAWLGQPLPEGQPDPGALNVAASFKTEGQKVILEEAAIRGEALDAVARGSVDVSGEVKKVALDIEAGMLDIDRYLPPPQKALQDAGGAAQVGGSGPANALAAIPDEPFDLSGLKGTDADIKLALAGLRVAGFEVGATRISTRLRGGKLALDISRLEFYGGGIVGRVDLDGSGDALVLGAEVEVSNLAVGELAWAAGVEPAPLTGIVTANLTAQAKGASPRALVEALSADLGFELAQARLAALPDAEIGKLDAKLAIPGLDQATTGEVQLTLDGQALEVSLDVDSLNKAMAGEAFALKVAIDSALLKASIEGLVQQQPLPGLDGVLSLEVASVGKLAAWLGQPLPEGQPDPGALKARVSLVADGEKLAVKSATINGKAAEATASGSFDGTGEIAKFDGKVNVAHLDLNAYLPPPSEEEAAPAGDKAQASQGWSEEPIDFSPLRQAEGNLIITTGPVLYREIKVQKIAATVSLSGGILKADVTKVQLSPGNVTASAVVDGSSNAAGIDYRVALQGVESKPFLRSFADMDFLSGKLNFEARGRARGANQKQIVESLNGAGAFAFLDGAIEGFDLAGSLRNLGQLGMASDGTKPKTDFTELSGSYTITDGLLQNGDLMMLAPLVRVTGAGQADLLPQTLDYNVEAKLVASLEGQGGSDALAGLPIPVHAYGPWDNLSYDVDYVTMFNAVALDPARLANLPADIAGQATNFGIKLPGRLGGVLGGAIGGLLGGGGQEQPAAEEGPAPTGEGPTPTVEGPAPTQQKKEPSILPDASKLLKGLFN